MRIKTFSAAIGAGVVLAFTAVIPASQAKEVDASHHSTSAMSAQTLSALEARWNAEAAGDKLMRARAQTAQVLKARGWYSEAKYYG
jgi:DNA-binding transcriptional MocR family regulator